ncbi:uncharacterized protein LOC106088946 [Stomoxys calcitrans]|uniref:uncharacterized protein LOC106088946 n=1 Tax=Stomoxys calcitrans TaxID=35570 RepID=UPI0027E26E1A|nr:uncharacterized protein LOC106088946 [Stomoxys calcitrans]
MLKFVLILSVALALVHHETEAFKVISINTGSAPASSTAAAPALDPSALLQGVQSALASKLQQIQALVGALVQQKTALKQNALNSLQGALGGVKSQVQGLVGQLRPPIVIRKQIYLGAPPPAATPAATTEADVDDDAATTKKE